MAATVALVAAVFVWPIAGPALAAAAAFAACTATFLLAASLSLNAQGRWHVLVGVLTVPGLLWLFFGFGAAACVADVQDLHRYGIRYPPSTVLLFAAYATIAAVCYLVGFALVFRDAARDPGSGTARVRPGPVIVVLLILLAIDWYGRYRLIHSGLYFAWVMKAALDKTVRGTSTLFHMQRTIGPIVLALLVYLATSLRRKWPYLALLACHLALIAANGDRSDFVFAMVVIVAAYAVSTNTGLTRKQMVLCAMAALVFFAVAGPIVQQARIMMRREARDLVRNPASIPIVFFRDYAKRVIVPDTMYEADSATEYQSLAGRLGSAMCFGASVCQAMLNGAPLRPWRDCRAELSQTVPRALYPGKPSVDADANLQRHFRIGEPGHDTNGTHLVSVFSFFHLPGVIVLYIVAGAGYGLVLRHLGSRYGRVGRAMFVGMLPLLAPMGDSFVQVFVHLRNVALLLVLFGAVLSLLPRLLAGGYVASAGQRGDRK